MMTHESYIGAVRQIALNHWSRSIDLTKMDQLEAYHRVANAKLLYGRGHRGLRGITQHGAWKNGQVDELIEICAMGEENRIQLAGTTIHELAHAANGAGHGHGKVWKAACLKLGLRRVMAAGTFYKLANFEPDVRHAIAALQRPGDGEPNLGNEALALLANRPCTAGIGVRGGTSRGPGSGRMRKYQCPHGQIVRAATDGLNAQCNECGGPFALQQ